MTKVTFLTGSGYNFLGQGFMMDLRFPLSFWQMLQSYWPHCADNSGLQLNLKFQV